MPTLVDVALAADRGDIYRVLLQTLEFTPMLKDIVRTATTPPKLALVKRCDEEIKPSRKKVRAFKVAIALIAAKSPK